VKKAYLKYLKKSLSVIHPLLFTLFFVLALYSANVAEVSPSEIWIPLFAALGFALVLLLIVLLLIALVLKLQTPQQQSQPYRIWELDKAAIVVSIIIVLVFSYGHVLSALGGEVSVFTLLLPIIWLVLFIVGAYFVVRTRRDLRKLIVVLSIVTVALLIIPAINIVIHETRSIPKNANVSEGMGNNTVDLIKPDTLPDIYYIILDRYASESTLMDVHGFDNSAFLDYLSGRGFYVANESRANYLKTRSCLASSLNMEYINYLSDQYGEEYQDLDPIYEIMEDYAVWRSLKAVGYEFIHYGSWWEPTRENIYADINSNYVLIPDFTMLLLRTTMAYPIASIFGVMDEENTVHYNCALHTFHNLAEIPHNEEPTFTFAHILLPHFPYVFNRNGNYQPLDEANRRPESANYIDQLIATNVMVAELIDGLLLSSEVRPIIILQADEGPFPPGTEFPEFKWEDVSEALLGEKYGILNAYYLPNIDQDILYPSISPVNSFRVVFNLYFGTAFNLLPDKSYAIYGGHPYKFFDVTDNVKYD